MKTRTFTSPTQRKLRIAFDELEDLVRLRRNRRIRRLGHYLLDHPRALLALGLGVSALIATFTSVRRER